MREIDPATFNPWKSNREQTPEAKLKIVRECAQVLLDLVKDLRQVAPASSSAVRQANTFLSYLEKEELLEFINEKEE